MQYGPHLIVDAYGCDPAVLGDLGAVYRLLDVLPELIGMQKIRPPLVQQHLNPADREWGITGDVIISTSHCAIHTYPARGVAFLDIFSCRPFDVDRAMEFLREALRPATMDTQVLQRGRKFHDQEVA